MRLLVHEDVWRPVAEAVEAGIGAAGLPVETAPLGSGPGEALLAGATLPGEHFLLAQAAGVRWVQVLTIGLEDVLSTALVESTVTLTSVGGVSAGAMAEFAFARILEQAKSLRDLAGLQAEKTWKPRTLDELAGETLAVVGLGPVGEKTAKLGQAFGMHVIGVRRRPEVGTGPCDEVVSPDDLIEVLERSKYVVLAAPLTDETKGMIGPRQLAAMPAGSLLVNLGRGALVDEAALLDSLRAGQLSAALDVFSEEPLPHHSPIWSAPSLAVSPHCSATTASVFEALAEVVLGNLDRYIAGKPLRNVVDKAAGYPVS